MDPVLMNLIGYAAVAAVGWFARHRFGGGDTPAPGPTPGGSTTGSPGGPVASGADVLSALSSITHRPAFQSLLHALADRASKTPTQVDDILIGMVQSLTAPPGTAPASPVPPAPK